MQRWNRIYLKVIGKCKITCQRIRESNIKVKGVNDKSEGRLGGKRKAISEYQAVTHSFTVRNREGN